MLKVHRLKSAGISRRELIALGGASAASTALLAACGEEDSPTAEGAEGGSDTETRQFGEGDVGILNYALTLEYLEAALYREAIGSGLVDGVGLERFREFGSQEEEHVAALTAAVRRLGGEPVPEPEVAFPLRSARSVLKLAMKMENLTAAAYLGQLPNVESSEVLASVLAIHSVEGRHATMLNRLVGDTIGPGGTYSAFGIPADAKTVLSAVEPFLAGGGAKQ